MRGDVVLAKVSGDVIAGTVHTLVDRVEGLRISGFPLIVAAKDCVLAKDAYDSVRLLAASDPDIASEDALEVETKPPAIEP